MKKVIYTCITGNYDNIIEPVKTQGWEYKLLTNNRFIKSRNFEVILINTIIDQVRTARCAKLNPWEYFEADLSIWVDANITITCNFDDIINQYKAGEFTVMYHPIRDCIYQEIEACKRGKKDNFEIMDAQIEKYYMEGYPPKNGMISSGLMIREHTSTVKDFCNKWWSEIVKGSYRDQLSFNYLAWKHNYKFDYMPFIFDKPEFGLMMNKHTKGKDIPRKVLRFNCKGKI